MSYYLFVCAHCYAYFIYQMSKLLIQYFLIIGIVFHWSFVLMATFWLLHLIHLFMKIYLPIWSRKLDRKRTKLILHVTEAVGAIILCSLAPIVYVSVSEYTFGRFPPMLCVPSRTVTFYTMCLPLCILLGSGVILAVIMFWMLHKVNSYIMLYCICTDS